MGIGPIGPIGPIKPIKPIKPFKPFKPAPWFDEAKYGMFIHWGLYAIPAGWWAGEKIPSAGEWILKLAKIPAGEYKKLAADFNPARFDAKAVVALAAEAGMKYIVFTAKHCEGFAMYDSAASDFTIAKSSPYKKDVVRALAGECERRGIVFCVYYSQYQDWIEPDGYGNDWDFPEGGKDFERYFRQKALPQVRELLTNYGRIGLIWFDTPYEMPEALCAELADCVNGLQPECLISGRVGYGLGDYAQMGDNSIPARPFEGRWETPMTLNDTWGYRKDDQNFKSPQAVLSMLVNVAGKGGNLLLNVGPDASGDIPGQSADILRKVGAWLARNGDSIYGTTCCPDFPYELNWGRFTRKGSKLYMHVLNWPQSGEIVIYGLKTRVLRAYPLADASRGPLSIAQGYETGRDQYHFRVALPERCADPLDTVVVLELSGEPEVYNY
ncbi:MAG: alpha-L-fucosidase [Clostridiales bacterium]|jgi:alpha-L-fucosidase|nr:alpha-L-fucosidase [Clostridiales bacterium]